jgi:hypothetical protein
VVHEIGWSARSSRHLAYVPANVCAFTGLSFVNTTLRYARYAKEESHA